MFYFRIGEEDRERREGRKETFDRLRGKKNILRSFHLPDHLWSDRALVSLCYRRLFSSSLSFSSYSPSSVFSLGLLYILSAACAFLFVILFHLIGYIFYEGRQGLNHISVCPLILINYAADVFYRVDNILDRQGILLAQREKSSLSQSSDCIFLLQYVWLLFDMKAGMPYGGEGTTRDHYFIHEKKKKKTKKSNMEGSVFVIAMVCIIPLWSAFIGSYALGRSDVQLSRRLSRLVKRRERIDMILFSAYESLPCRYEMGRNFSIGF